MADFGSQIADHVREKLGAMQQAVIEPSGEKAIELTRRNTRHGKGFGDEEFVRYAPSTARKKGRSAPVTFRHTGATMASLFPEAAPDRGEITFSHNDRIMDYHQKGEGRNPKREIFPEAPRQTPTVDEFTRFVEAKLEAHMNET